MPHVYTSMSSGLAGLDTILQGIMPGDGIVWQIDTIDQYIPFVQHFCLHAVAEQRKCTYFRFAKHCELISTIPGTEIIQLNPKHGFEPCIMSILSHIEKNGIGSCYVFDCVSELTEYWYSDRVLSNFFKLLCSHLYDHETAAYFSLRRNHHMEHAISSIHAAAHVILDVYSNHNTFYVHPLKVHKRHSTTMYNIHKWSGVDFIPVTNSAIISEIMSKVPQPWLDLGVHMVDTWTQVLKKAQALLTDTDKCKTHPEEMHQIINTMLPMFISQDKQFLPIAAQYFSLEDLVDISKRIIGTGLIGGKSAGMLLSRAILGKKDIEWKKKLEVHDSFYIGSDVFYTYLIENGCWWIRRKTTNFDDLLDSADDARQRILFGQFSEDLIVQFESMLNYFGQSPIIVRSSSLLEDAFGNAFSGKYDSVFCANQGTPQERLEKFMNAVRIVYASTMYKETLLYRQHWGLLEHDEQMSILVQRVSGQKYKDLYFPHIAGVAFSFNPFAWSPDIDPRAGVMRLVFGLGTRAVDRSDDDYTRIIAMNAPSHRPDHSTDEIRKYTQRKVDVLDLKNNIHTSKDFTEVARVAMKDSLDIDIFASIDDEILLYNPNLFPYVLTFDTLLANTDFVQSMAMMLQTLQQAYNRAVDIEFTTCFIDRQNYRINLVQCRPFQVKHSSQVIQEPQNIDVTTILFETKGPIIGSSTSKHIKRIIYVVPETYSDLSMSDRYTVARIIGKITHLETGGDQTSQPCCLIGPGRWGTTTPALGVPVSFSEINTVSVICELAKMHEGLIPDVSLGTHFFNDLVENDMLYIALYPQKNGYRINEHFLQTEPSLLSTLLPDASPWEHVIRVLDFSNRNCILYSDTQKQHCICFLDALHKPVVTFSV